jgi:hypothetical protein
MKRLLFKPERIKERVKTAMTLTNRLISLLLVTCPLLLQGQVYVGTKMTIGSGIPFTIVNNNPTANLNIFDSLNNNGLFLVTGQGMNVNVSTTGRLTNTSQFNTNKNVNASGSGVIRNSITGSGYFKCDSSLVLTGNSQFINSNSTDTAAILRDLIIGGNAHFNQLNGISYVQRDVQVNSVTGQITNKGFIRVDDNWNNLGTYSDTGIVSFAGSNMSTINNNTSPIHRLRLNTNNITVRKQAIEDLRVSSLLTLTEGILETVSGKKIILDSSARISRTSPFSPLVGGHIFGTLERQLESNAGIDQMDSLYFPMGTNPNFAPFVIRDFAGTLASNPSFSVRSFDPAAVGSGSFDVAQVLNNDIGWELSVSGLHQSFKVNPIATTSSLGSVGVDTMIVAQSSSESGVYESLGRSDTASVGPIRSVQSDKTPDLSFIALAVSRNVKLRLKVLAQGRHSSGTTMNSDPTYVNTVLSPRFNNYIISEYHPIPSTVIDSISVSLRPCPICPDVVTIPAWLMADGSVRDFRTITDSTITFASLDNGDYHVVIRHRNHLSLMSSSTINLVTNGDGFTDLTTISNIYGGGAAALTGTSAVGMYAGNARNNNQEVNAGDEFDVISQNLQTGYRLTDVDLSGETNALDVDITREGSYSLYFSTVP